MPKYGLHINTASDKPHAAYLLDYEQAETMRLPMFFGNRSTQQFSNTDVANLITKNYNNVAHGQPLREVIVNGPEDCFPDQTIPALASILHLPDWWPNQLWVFELSNELDWRNGALTADPNEKRRRVLETMKRIRADSAFRKPNLLFAINQPSDNAPDWWWSDFNRDWGDGYGAIIKDNVQGSPAPYAPDLLTVHCYSDNSACETKSFKILDWTLGWINQQSADTPTDRRQNIKVTECGIHTREDWDNTRGKRYVDYALRAEDRGRKIYYGVDSVCFFATPPAGDSVYDFSYNDAAGVGSRQRLSCG
jgi:hypothetical protein